MSKDFVRKENTQYIAMLSYGKDSIRMLEAIKELGWPLDRIITADVWATDDIPADLPPMVAFKEYADKAIMERYGIPVEHVCATAKVEGGGVCDQRIAEASTNHTCILQQKESCEATESLDSHPGAYSGATACLKQPLLIVKQTYERLFYHLYTPKPKTEKGRLKESARAVGGGAVLSIYGFPYTGQGWCRMLKRTNLRIPCHDKFKTLGRREFWASQSSGEIGAADSSVF